MVPRPGQLDVHPVAAETLTATLDGRRLTVTVDWWSGVEPCTILDTVVVETEAGGYAITLREGAGLKRSPASRSPSSIARSSSSRTTLHPVRTRSGTAPVGHPAIEVVIS